ncbi:hypothetical protein D3C78_428040 [compost metagenome]
MTIQMNLLDDILIAGFAPGHGSNFFIEVPDSLDISEEEIKDLLPPNDIPMVTTWPKRSFESVFCSRRKTDVPVSDFYDYLKPREIGMVRVLEFVKGNKGWILHGRVQYHGGHHVQHECLNVPRVVVLSVDRERGNPSSGRRAIGLDRLMVSPK